MKPLSPIAETPEEDIEDISCLKSILVFGDYVGERSILEVVLIYWFCKLVKVPSFWLQSIVCDVFLRENSILRESGLWGSWILFYLMAVWVCCRFLTVRMLRLEKTICVNSVRECAQKWRDVTCLLAWRTNCVLFWSQKSCGSYFQYKYEKLRCTIR